METYLLASVGGNGFPGERRSLQSVPGGGRVAERQVEWLWGLGLARWRQRCCEGSDDMLFECLVF